MIRASFYLVRVELNCCVVILLVKDSVEWAGLTLHFHRSVGSDLRYLLHWLPSAGILKYKNQEKAFRNGINTFILQQGWTYVFNLYSPCVLPSRTLTPKRFIWCIYSTNITNIVTEYFKHGIHSPFFSLQNAVCFIVLTYLVPVLFTFYIQGVLKLKK